MVDGLTYNCKSFHMLQISINFFKLALQVRADQIVFAYLFWALFFSIKNNHNK